MGESVCKLPQHLCVQFLIANAASLTNAQVSQLEMTPAMRRPRLQVTDGGHCTCITHILLVFMDYLTHGNLSLFVNLLHTDVIDRADVR